MKVRLAHFRQGHFAPQFCAHRIFAASVMFWKCAFPLQGPCPHKKHGLCLVQEASLFGGTSIPFFRQASVIIWQEHKVLTSRNLRQNFDSQPLARPLQGTASSKFFIARQHGLSCHDFFSCFGICSRFISAALHVKRVYFVKQTNFNPRQMSRMLSASKVSRHTADASQLKLIQLSRIQLPTFNKFRCHFQQIMQLLSLAVKAQGSREIRPKLRQSRLARSMEKTLGTTNQKP